jgi:hypothetical protein
VHADAANVCIPYCIPPVRNTLLEIRQIYRVYLCISSHAHFGKSFSIERAAYRILRSVCAVYDVENDQLKTLFSGRDRFEQNATKDYKQFRDRE